MEKQLSTILSSLIPTYPTFATICLPALPASLAVGASASCVIGPISVTTAPTPNPKVNTATVTTSTYTPVIPVTSSAMYGTQSLAIVKNVTESYFTAAGNLLHYSYTVTNNGGYPLAGPVTVVDDKVGTVTCQDPTAVGDLDSYLDKGEAVYCPGPLSTDTVSYLVTATDVTNRLVTNTAHGEASGVKSPDAVKTVPLVPDLSVTKTNIVSDTVVLGNTFDWTLTVSNSANAGGATFLSGATLLTDDLPSTGANYSVPVTATNSGGTTGTINCSILTNTLTCLAGTDVTIPTSGSFSIAVTVTPTTARFACQPSVCGCMYSQPGSFCAC